MSFDVLYDTNAFQKKIITRTYTRKEIINWLISMILRLRLISEPADKYSS